MKFVAIVLLMALAGIAMAKPTEIESSLEPIKAELSQDVPAQTRDKRGLLLGSAYTAPVAYSAAYTAPVAYTSAYTYPYAYSAYSSGYPYYAAAYSAPYLLA